MNFLGALLMLVLTSLVILPLIMFAGIIAFDFWPVIKTLSGDYCWSHTR